MSSPLSESTAARPSRRLRSPLLPIFLIVAVDVLGMTIILPLLPFYAERLGASPTVVGSLVSVFAVCQLIAGPILGQLSDRYGRKPLLVISQIGTLLGFVLLAEAHSLWLIFLSRMIDGATAGNLTIAQAYISDVTKAEDRTKSFAIIGVAFGLGFLIGPAMSGYLAQFGYRTPIYAAVGLSALSIFCTTVLLPRKEQVIFEDEETAEQAPVAPGGQRLTILSWGRYRQFFQNDELARLLVRWALFAFSFSMFVSGFALFAERRYTWDGHTVGPREVGYIFAWGGFLGIIMQGGVVGRLVKYFGEKRMVQIGFAASCIGYAAIGFTKTIRELLVVNTFASIGGSGLRPALTSLITQRAGRREQGVIIGLTQSIMSVAQIAAPIIGGYLIDQHLLTIWAVCIGLLTGLALLV